MRPFRFDRFASLALPFVAIFLGACGPAPTADPPATPFSVVTVIVPASVQIVIPGGGDPTAPTPAAPGASDFGRPTRIANGLEGRVYALPSTLAALPDFSTFTPLGTIYTTALDITPRKWDQGFPGVSDRNEWFGIDYSGTFTVATAAAYSFRLTADDGAKLFIDGVRVLDDDGIHPPKTTETIVNLAVGAHRIRVPYFQGPRFDIALLLEVSRQGEPYRVFHLDQPLGGHEVAMQKL